MKRRTGIIILLILVLAAFIVIPMMKSGAGDSEEVEMATFDLPGDPAAKYGDEIPIKFRIPAGLTKVELLYNDSVFETWNNPKEQTRTVALKTDYYGVGSRNLVLRSTFKDGTVLENSTILRVLSDIAPEVLFTKIIKEYPHNIENYTQGYEFDGNQLYESTGDPGQQGKTKLGKVTLETGQFIDSNGLDATYFGEGITIFGDQIYQITWQNGKCFVYDKKTMLMQKNDYSYVGQGWGLCNDGKFLIMSDGSERITFRDPKTFQAVKVIEVYDMVEAKTNLNELEYIDGKIYANVYTTGNVLVIEPTTGRVLQEIDANELVVRGKGANGDVLNGIAHNKLTKKTYMTGKYWPKAFEVQFVKQL